MLRSGLAVLAASFAFFACDRAETSHRSADDPSVAADADPALALANACGRLNGGESLRANSPQDSARSCANNYRLVMQGDGNLVQYPVGAGAATWSTGTYNRGGVTAAMQGDGNFVVYAASGAPLWHTHTSGNPGAYLAVQDDGNVVVYTAANKALWSSRTGLLADIGSVDVGSRTIHCLPSAARGADINRCLATARDDTEMFGARWTVQLTGKVYALIDASDLIVLDFPVVFTADAGAGRCGWLDRNVKSDVYDSTCPYFQARPGLYNPNSDKIGLVTAVNSHDVVVNRIIVDGNYLQRRGQNNCNLYDEFGMTACADVAFVRCADCQLLNSAIANGVNDDNMPHYGYMSGFIDTPRIVVVNNLFAHAGKTAYVPTPVFASLDGQRQNCFEMVARTADVRGINVGGNEVFECGDGGLVFNAKQGRALTGNIQYNSLFQRQYMNISHEILVYTQAENPSLPWSDLGGPWNGTDPNQVLMIHDNVIDCAWGGTHRGCPVGITIGGRGWKQDTWLLGGRVFRNTINAARIGIDINQGGMRGSILGDRLTNVQDNCFDKRTAVKINFLSRGISDVVANRIVGNCQSGGVAAYDNVDVPTFTAHDTWSCSWGRGNPDCRYPQYPDP
jgi:hypothetical protein